MKHWKYLYQLSFTCSNFVNTTLWLFRVDRKQLDNSDIGQPSADPRFARCPTALLADNIFMSHTDYFETLQTHPLHYYQPYYWNTTWCTFAYRLFSSKSMWSWFFVSLTSFSGHWLNVNTDCNWATFVFFCIAPFFPF